MSGEAADQRVPSTVRLYAVTVGLTGFALALWFPFAAGHRVVGAPFELPLWSLILAYAATEMLTRSRMVVASNRTTRSRTVTAAIVSGLIKVRRGTLAPPLRRTPMRKLIAAAGEGLTLSSQPTGSDLPPPVDLADHARRLLDVLSVADAIPVRPPAAPLRAPRLVSR